MTLWGINTQTIQSNCSQYFINTFKAWPGWATRNAGGTGTNEGWNILVDSTGNIVTFAASRNGTALTAISAIMWGRRFEASGSWLYPDDSTDGAGSYKFIFNGRGTFSLGDDIASPASVSNSTSGVTTTTTCNVTASTSGMKVTITATGFNGAATFSGSTVTVTGSNFTTDTPVCFRGGTLPNELSADKADGTVQVYYVLSGATANTFQISATKGGTPITFTGSPVSVTAYGDWARDLALVRSSHLTAYNSGQVWNPDYVSKYSGVKCVRFMQTMNTYQYTLHFSNVTFSGTTVTWSGSSFRPGNSVTFQPNSATDVLPTPLDCNTTYFVLQSGLTVNSFQIATTQGGTPITFGTATGTINGIGYTTLCDKDITPDNFIGYAHDSGPYDTWGRAFNGPPPEALIDLCYRLGGASGCGAWINIPGLSDTSWSTAFAQRLYAKYTALGCSFKIYVELGNEIWSHVGTAPPSTGGANLTTGMAARYGALFPSGNNFSSGAAYGYANYAAIQNMNAFKNAWISAGGDGTKIVKVWGGQNGFPAYSFGGGNQGLLTRLATVDGGQASYWTGVAGTHYDAYATAPYMNGGEELPDAWTADPDGGVGKFYTEYNSGGLLFVSGAAATTTAGTSTAFTATGAVGPGGATATDTNQQVINITFHVTSGASATLAVNGGPAYPLQDRTGATLGSGQTGTQSFVLTKTTSAGAVGTPGWRQQPYSYSGGMMQAGLGWTALDKSNMDSFNTANGTSLYLIAYEGGQTMSDFGRGDTIQANLVYACNRSSQMGQTYTSYLSQIPANGMNDVFCHFCDFESLPPNGTNTQGQFFGLLESVMESSNAKYAAYMAFVNAHRSGHGKGLKYGF